MASLTDLETFVAIADAGSLTGAARRLGRSLQSVSRSLANLEAEHGSSLISRTTRAMRVTPAGAVYCGRIRSALLDIAAAREELLRAGAALSGRLRIAASTAFGAATLTPHLAVFMVRHPAIEIELGLDDITSDLVSEGVDLAVRTGDLPDSTLVVRKIGLIYRVLAASPSYLAVHGTPATPQELASHRGVCRAESGDSEIWQFQKDGAVVRVSMTGHFRSDNAAARLSAIVAGAGIGRVPLIQVKPLVESGSLQRVLQDFEMVSVPISLAWPSGAPMTARLRALVDFLVPRLSGELS